jgi:hypothetical protein
MKTAPRTIITFQLLMDTMKAQYILEKAGYCFDVVVPPDELCECCELGLVINPTEQYALEKVLKENDLHDYRFSQLTF